MSGMGIFINLISGAIGFAAFLYGKRQGFWKTMALGIALIAFPYFITDVRIQLAVGAVLIISLFIFKD